MSEGKYKLQEVYGLDEIPTKHCPTYIERDVHKQFEYLINNESQHVIVYGASRQGKTWMVERYCPNAIRIGCDAKTNREMLFKSILNELDIRVGDETVSSGYKHGGKMGAGAEGEMKVSILGKGKANIEGEIADEKFDTNELVYVNIDVSNQSEVIKAIKDVIKDRFIIIENFHYLNIEVQKSFASSLREFLYHNIRVIIVGVWKETTKLTSYASDLSNRCEYIDIGEWNKQELELIVKKGDDALNTKISNDIIQLLIKHSGYNVGIFKSLLKNFCKECMVFETVEGSLKKGLDDNKKVSKAIDKNFNEVIIPVLERIDNLATSKKSNAKGMRYYIVKAILDIMSQRSSNDILQGIDYQDIVNQIVSYNCTDFQPSNIKQELINLHLREETGDSDKDMNKNLIPLFYFDRGKGNGKLLVVESALISARESEKIYLNNCLGPIEDYLKSRQ